MSSPHAHPGQDKTVPPLLPAPRVLRSTWIRLAWAWMVVAAFALGGDTWLAAPLTPPAALACFAVLFGTIIAASFGVVHEADTLAHKLGEPYGTLILTLSIVLIEVILIASVLLGPGEFPTIARDSIVAVMMIIVNLVMGLCLIVGGRRHTEQAYNAQGTSTYLSMIALLTLVTLVLPAHLSASGTFNVMQAWLVAGITGTLYTVFLARQMLADRRLYLQPPAGEMTVAAGRFKATGKDGAPPDRDGVWLSTALLIATIIPIVLLAHHLAVVIDYGVATVGAPVAVGGVLIATIVFTPESITAVKAAANNEMQRAINLCLGAFVSTIGLTVPAVLVIGLMTGKTVTMGISSVDTVLLVATILLMNQTFKGHRTTPVQGYMHLALFAVYGFTLFRG